MHKPHSTLLLIGPRGHGKTSLAAGLLRASRPAEPGDVPLDELPREQVIPLLRSAPMALALVPTAIESARRRYTLLDPGEPQAIRKRLIAGPLAGLAAIAGAVVVVDAGLGCTPEFKEDLRLLRRVGVSGLVVFLNRAAAEDPEFVDLAEHELRVELCAAGIAGDTIPIVRGSIQSLRDGEPAGTEAALTVYEALDHHVADRVGEPPRFVVARVLARERREPEADCRVLRGALEPDDRIEIGGLTPTRVAQLVSVAAAPHEPGSPGDRVRCTLRGVVAEDLRVGQVLALQGTFTPHSRFEAEIWFFTPRARQIEEWQVACFDVVTVGGVARPVGDSAHGYEIELSAALVLVPGDGFGLIVDGEVVGVGVVVAVRGAPRKRRCGALSPTGLAVAFVDSLHRGDRPDIAASLLLPPEDVLQATVPAFAEDLRSDIRSGRILLRLIDDGSSGHSDFVRFDYRQILARHGSVEFVGPCKIHPRSTWHLGRGDSRLVYVDVEARRSQMREYWLSAGLTVCRIRFQIAVTRGEAREDMRVTLAVAEFDVRPGVWYIFDFECPYSWQTL